VTGAGLSIWAGYGTWQQVINRLAEAVRRQRGTEVNVDVVLQNNRNLLHCAGKLGDYLGRSAFEEFMRAEFGPVELPLHPLLRTVAELPLQHVFTFNFEESLERALSIAGHRFSTLSCANQGELARLLRNLDNADCPKQIVHLHGKLSDPIIQIALTEEGYRGLYRREPLFPKLLWLLGATRSLVFVGFGFADHDFCHELQQAARDLQTAENCHFALLGLAPDENDQERRNYFNNTFLIEPVFYDVLVNEGHADHSQFEELIYRIADALRGAGARRPTTNEPAQRIVPDLEGLDLAQRLVDRVINRLDPGGHDVQD
jgi:hypothetical protein